MASAQTTQTKTANVMGAVFVSSSVWVVVAVVQLLLIIGGVWLFVNRERKLKAEIEHCRRIIEKYKEEKAQALAAAEKEDDVPDIAKGIVPNAPQDPGPGTFGMRENATNKGLYDLILQVMRDEKPYANENFDIDRLVELVNSNRTYVSRAINAVYGKNFRSWLADYRNAMVIQALKKDPHIEVPRLAHHNGYGNSETLVRQFRKHNGMTIAEFRTQLFDD